MQYKHLSKSSGIYQIKNLTNNKIYIGSAVNIQRRIYEHQLYLKKGLHHNQHLQRSVNKYGIDNFEASILLLAPKNQLLAEETNKIYELKSNLLHTGYNMENCGATWLGRTHTPETKEKLRQARKKQVIPPEVYKKIAEKNRGRKLNLSPEARKKISERSKNMDRSIFKTESHRNKMKVVNKQNAINRAQPFVCLETNEIFYSTTDAANKLGIPSYKAVWRVLKKQRNHTHGYHFEYCNKTN